MQTNPIRRQFPALSQRVNGQPLAYLDSAATTQKPSNVIAAIQQFYRRDNANVHRGAHLLSERATNAYESAREKLADWLGTQVEQVIWTAGTTAGINHLASSLAEQLQAGDQIIVSALEHHANLVPWQRLAKLRGAELLIAPIDAQGTIDCQQFSELLNPRVKLVALSHLSNVLGTIQPVAQLCQLARAVGAITIVDGAQAAAHLNPQPETLGCDFYLFSGHKMYGPTGIGVLWGRRDQLEALAPWHTGGEMVKAVSYQDAVFAPLPQRLEAGTPNIAGAVGMAAAVDFIRQQVWQDIAEQEQLLLNHCREVLLSLPGVTLLPYSEQVAATVGFNLAGYHPADVAQWLDHCGVAVRAGHHCAQPLHEQLGLNGSVRVSLACYSQQQDIEQLLDALRSLPEAGKELVVAEPELPPQAVLEQVQAVKGWEASYQLLVKLAQALPPNPAIRNIEYQVAGCDSRTWVKLEPSTDSSDNPSQPRLIVESESAVVRGLLVIIRAIVQSLPLSQWRYEIFMQRLEVLNLLPFVSETRVNGISAVLRAIEVQANNF